MLMFNVVNDVVVIIQFLEIGINYWGPGGHSIFRETLKCEDQDEDYPHSLR